MFVIEAHIKGNKYWVAQDLNDKLNLYFNGLRDNAKIFSSDTTAQDISDMIQRHTKGKVFLQVLQHEI